MDRFITMQTKSVEGEFIVMMAAAVLMAVFSRHYNYGDVTASFLILFLPLFLLDLWMIFRIFRKIFDDLVRLQNILRHKSTAQFIIIIVLADADVPFYLFRCNPTHSGSKRYH